MLCWVLFKFLLQDQAEESLDLEDSLMLYEETPEATPEANPEAEVTPITRLPHQLAHLTGTLHRGPRLLAGGRGRHHKI